jgi:hypothetical protein
MTLFQILSMWLLRFILAWGAFELGMSLYAETLALAEKTGALNNHAAVMDRLTARAGAAERVAQTQRGALDAVWVWPLGPSPTEAPAPGAVVAEALRGELLGSGVSELVIDTAEAPVIAGLSRIAINARWREPADRAPLALRALAARRPKLSIVALTLQQRDAVVETQARFEIYVRAGARP